MKTPRWWGLQSDGVSLAPGVPQLPADFAAQLGSFWPRAWHWAGACPARGSLRPLCAPGLAVK